MAKTRDDFSAAIRLQIAKRAGWLCSCPHCRKPTVGAMADGEGSITIGTAAHICAAAPGGPRYDPDMTARERGSVANGIWMCRDHGTAIDSDPEHFTVEVLRRWKTLAEADSWRRVLAMPPLIPDVLPTQRLLEAARDDIAVLRATPRWPRGKVALGLRVDGVELSMTTAALAPAVRSLGDILVVAAPGVGKTTTLLQTAEGAILGGAGVPIFVSLGDWATEGKTILESILGRPAFRSVTETELRDATHAGQVMLLLDGWNEVGPAHVDRARVEILALKARAPALCLVVSTRQGSTDVPLPGKRVELLGLSEAQQAEVAELFVGQAAHSLLDAAWRTPGLRDLVSVPLYLNAMLAAPWDPALPATREGVLGRLVSAHQADPGRGSRIRAVTRGSHQRYLEALAVRATGAGATALSDADARAAVSKASLALLREGQIAAPPEPVDVLDALVDGHVLVRLGDASSVAFQHQQFQEWFASHDVERRMRAAGKDGDARRRLQAEVLDWPMWEEAILFAAERMSRGTAEAREACAAALLAALEVDPMLAAEMIHRSDVAVWRLVGDRVRGFVGLWHVPGHCDRAQRFMMDSGRPEFLDQLWPLLARVDEQASLEAIRNCRALRPSILGDDPGGRIRSLVPRARETLLVELAYDGGLEGIEIAAALARADPDPSVQAGVAEALQFRRAGRHLLELLAVSADAALDRVAHHWDALGPEDIIPPGLVAALARAASATAPIDRLRHLATSPPHPGCAGEVADLVSRIGTFGSDGGPDVPAYLLWQAYPRAVVAGLIERVRGGHSISNGDEDVLAASETALEDDSLLALALAQGDDRMARAAASLLGPRAVGRLLEACSHAEREASMPGRPGAAYDRWRAILALVDRTPAPSLLGAVQARSDMVSAEEIPRLAELLRRRFDEGGPRTRAFAAANLDEVRELGERWAKRLLGIGNVPRQHLATVATLFRRVPHVRLLATLRSMLDDNLARYSTSIAAAAAAQWRPGPDTDQARSPETHQYFEAFLSIDARETREAMCGYLSGPHFGPLAARVIVSQVLGAMGGGAGPGCAGSQGEVPVWDREAEQVARVARELLADAGSEQDARLGVELAIEAARLPRADLGALTARVAALAPRRAWARFNRNRASSGATLPFQVVVDGIDATLRAAQDAPWVLEGEAWELREWLRLLPCTDDPSRIVDAVRAIPSRHRTVRNLRDLLSAYEANPAEGGEEALFDLAAFEPGLYQEYAWHRASVRVAGVHALARLVALAADGVLDGRHWQNDLARLIIRHPEVRHDVYARLREDVWTRGHRLLAAAVAEAPDEDGLVLLVEAERRTGLYLVEGRAIESLVTERLPSPGLTGAYEVVPVAAPSLRRRLMAMVPDGGSKDPAIRALALVDEARDRWGLPRLEPRHPDLSSGKPWPPSGVPS